MQHFGLFLCLYIRLACADHLAAASQREELERYAKDKGYEVAAAVAADGISGVHMCKCAAERREREEAKRREYERMSYMTMLRSEAFRDIPAALWRFDAVPVMTAQLSKVKQYVENWDSFKRDESGFSCLGMSAPAKPMRLAVLPTL